MSLNALSTRLEIAPALLEQAVTHRSFDGEIHYERLEFLGDRVLGVVVAEWLWERFEGADEGELSRRLGAMVRESTLVAVAEAWRLKDVVRIGAGEVLKDSILADVVEAILGAVWLDGGLEAARAVVRRDWSQFIDLKDEKDPKSRLQELLQGDGLELPLYEVVKETGRDHDKWFIVMVKCAKGEAVGEGRSKQVAGSEAAANLLKRIDI